MLPFTRKTAANIKTVLDTLEEGSLTNDLTGTFGSTSSLPLFTDAPSDLVTAVITANLTGATSTISNVGLASQSITWLDGIRSRIDEAVADIYVDTPANSPYYYANAVAKSTSLQNNARDRILQSIFRFDARYYGRRRTSTTYSGENQYFEYPTRHNYLDCPTIIAHLREHSIYNITSIDDTGAGGAYRITSSAPHGLYDAMSIFSTGTDTGSAVTKQYWMANVYSEVSSTFDGTDTNTKFWFNSNIGTNYLIDADTVVGAGPNTVGGNGGGFLVSNGNNGEWIPFYFQPERYFKLTDGGASFELYYDAALTSKIYPGYGYVKGIDVAYANAFDDPTQSATGGIKVLTSDSDAAELTHMMFEDTPQIFARPAGWTGNASIYERKGISTVDPYNGVWTASTSGFSIYDGQLTNFASMGSSGWENINNLTTPLYFKKLTTTTFSLYTDAALTTLWKPGTSSGTLSSASTGTGTLRLTFNTDYINLMNGLAIYTTSTSTPISASLNIDSKSGSNPETLTLSANHSFQNGQPVRLIQDGTQLLYAKTSGVAANQVQLYTTVSWAGSTPTFSNPYTATVNNDIAPVFYVKRISNTVFECYVDPALAVGYTFAVDLTGFTTGNILTSYVSTTYTYTPPANGYIQPMFFCRMGGYYDASLWVDAARTIPYAYYQQNGVFGTAGFYSATEGNIPGGTPGTYYINNIGHKYKFTSNADAVSGSVVQAYFVDVVSSTAVDLYADESLGYKITSPATASIAGGTFTATYLDNNVSSGRYRLDTLETVNMGAESYWYDSDGDGVDDSINAGWYDSGMKYYTSHYETNTVNVSGPTVIPDLITEEYRFSNSGAYYGRLRNVVSSGSTTAQGPVVQSDTTTYSSVGTGPCYYTSSDPGRFTTSADVVIRISAYTDAAAVTLSSDQVALANTAPEWDTVSNMTGRLDRYWPSTIQPTGVSWTIEQPNQTFETLNMNRFVRAKEQTQYRIRCSYPPMTKTEFKDFHDIILAARGSFKPMKLLLPTYGGTAQGTNSMYGRYFDRINNTDLPYQLRFRNVANGGERLIKIDGAPRNRDQADTSGTGDLYVFGKGHACSMGDAYDLEQPGYKSQLGGWVIPIHNVESNEYGEINIRVNNGMPGVMPVGTRFFRDSNDLDVFLDGNSIEIRVDSRGFHYLEVEFVTKKIF